MIYFIFPLGFFASPLSLSYCLQYSVGGKTGEEQLHLAAPINDFIRIRIVSALH